MTSKIDFNGKLVISYMVLFMLDMVQGETLCTSYLILNTIKYTFTFLWKTHPT